jgi:hypothetical protein
VNMLDDRTAAQLADALEAMDGFPHNTGGLSVLDEATLEYGWRYPQVGAAQRAFANARHAHMRSYRTEAGSYSDEAWQRAMAAAHSLAAALRPLGGLRLARCARPSEWGTCGLALDDDGTCHSRDHAAPPETPGEPR